MEQVSMSKITSLQAQLERKTARVVAPEPETPVVADAPKPVTAKASSREGKVHIGAYLPEGFQTSILAVRAQTREDVQTLLARALNDLFKAHNVPVIDLK